MATLAHICILNLFSKEPEESELSVIASLGYFIRCWERSKGCSSLRVYCCLVKTTGFQSSVFETRIIYIIQIPCYQQSHPFSRLLVALQIFCHWFNTFKFSSGSSSFKRLGHFWKICVKPGPLFCLLCQGKGKREYGLLVAVGCARLWLLLGLGRDDTGHWEPWQAASGSFPSWQGGGQSGSKQLGCQWKLVHMLSLAGKLLVPGLATILTGKAE